MKQLLLYILLAVLAVACPTDMSAQAVANAVADTAAVAVADSTALAGGQKGRTNAGKRYVTPVEVKTNRTLMPRKGEKLKYIERDSLTLDSLRRDSIEKIYPRYPKLTDITVGVGIGDAIGRLFGQDYSSFDVSASVNMWNRIAPVIELGVGWAKTTPEGLNYTYRGKMAPYVKIGANYNFMFKSLPDYQLFGGIRVGYSSFKYDLMNVAMSSGSYWNETVQTDLLNQKSHALWGEVVLGIRVKLWRGISAGWTVKYHNVFKYGKNTYGDPWFVPGYGSRTSKLAVGLSLYYTIPTSKKKWPKIDENGKLMPEVAKPGDDAPADGSSVAEPAKTVASDTENK